MGEEKNEKMVEKEKRINYDDCISYIDSDDFYYRSVINDIS